MAEVPAPSRVVHAAAPIRVGDNGGWTDTWFAGHGEVFNIAVSPFVEVQLRVHPIGSLPDRVVLDVENYGDHYCFDPDASPGRHPLLEATIAEIGLPADTSVELSISSDAPAGCSTGTSASATVALIGALDALTPGRMTPHEVAYAAHRVEVERLGIQAGVQDQLCAAYGGINSIEIASYPHASVTQLCVPEALWSELDQRLVLVFLGRAHISSEVHDRVIAGLERDGERSPHLDALRRAAREARDAVEAADLSALGRSMVANTDAQRRLHPDLVGTAAQMAIDIAAANNASGWKVNGAGGEGGSLTVLCDGNTGAKRRLVSALERADPLFRSVPIRLSRHGLRVRES